MIDSSRSCEKIKKRTAEAPRPQRTNATIKISFLIFINLCSLCGGEKKLKIQAASGGEKMVRDSLRCPVTTSFGGRGITPKYAERNTLDLRAGALKTPRVSPLASIDIEIAWENPLSSRHLGRGIFCGLSHAISISMAQREALGRSWRFQSPGQRISASRKMRDPIYQLRY